MDLQLYCPIITHQDFCCPDFPWAWKLFGLFFPLDSGTGENTRAFFLSEPETRSTHYLMWTVVFKGCSDEFLWKMGQLLNPKCWKQGTIVNTCAGISLYKPSLRQISTFLLFSLLYESWLKGCDLVDVGGRVSKRVQTVKCEVLNRPVWESYLTASMCECSPDAWIDLHSSLSAHVHDLHVCIFRKCVNKVEFGWCFAPELPLASTF